MARARVRQTGDPIANLAEKVEDALRFDRHGLAEKIQLRVAGLIRDRTLRRQLGPDGSPLAPNTPKTVARKGHATVGREGDEGDEEMLSLDELAGELDADPGRMTMAYGTSTSARAKARIFTEGNPRGEIQTRHGPRPHPQPPRPFYELGADGAEAVLEVIREHVREVLGGGI